MGQNRIVVQIVRQGGEGYTQNQTKAQEKVSSLSNKGNASNKISSLQGKKGESTISSILKSVIGKGTLTSGNIAISIGREILNDAIYIGVNQLQRVGAYTGNQNQQATINNAFTAIGLAKSFLSNPITFGIDMAYKYSDFNLQKYKDNLEAQYQAFLLNDINNYNN